MSNRMREFTLGLIYDAIGWTPDVTPQLAAVRNAIGLTKKSEVTREDFHLVRDLLTEAGLHTAPPPQCSRCKGSRAVPSTATGSGFERCPNCVTEGGQ
jgi:hypothetical protein